MFSETNAHIPAGSSFQLFDPLTSAFETKTTITRIGTKQLVELQEKGARRRCFCSKKPACHFTVCALAKLVHEEDKELYHHYIAHDGHTRHLQQATQKLLAVPVQTINRKNAYDRSSIFGAELSRCE